MLSYCELARPYSRCFTNQLHHRRISWLSLLLTKRWTLRTEQNCNSHNMKAGKFSNGRVSIGCLVNKKDWITSQRWHLKNTRTTAVTLQCPISSWAWNTSWTDELAFHILRNSTKRHLIIHWRVKIPLIWSESSDREKHLRAWRNMSLGANFPSCIPHTRKPVHHARCSREWNLPSGLLSFLESCPVSAGRLSYWVVVEMGLSCSVKVGCPGFFFYQHIEFCKRWSRR